MTAPTALSATATYVALDLAYRAATARTSLAVARALELRWSSIDPDNIARTSGPWLADAIEIIVSGQRQAHQYANLYTDGVRRLAAPDAPLWTPPPLKPPNIQQIRESLIYTGLSTTAREVKRVESVEQTSSQDVEPVQRDSAARTSSARKAQLMQEAFDRVAASATKFVTVAGHDQIYENVQSDRRALGWVRTTKPGCCFFCAMLASRGRVYKEESFAESDPRFTGPGNQKVHDHCGCGMRPVYGDGDDLPERTAEFEDLWVDSQKKRKPGESAINAFRRMYAESPLSQPFME